MTDIGTTEKEGASRMEDPPSQSYWLSAFGGKPQSAILSHHGGFGSQAVSKT
jgi:hypothetical protein